MIQRASPQRLHSSNEASQSDLTTPLLGAAAYSDDSLDSKKGPGHGHPVGRMGTLKCYEWITDPALMDPGPGTPSQADSKASSKKAWSFFFNRSDPPPDPKSLRLESVKRVVFPEFQRYIRRIFRKELEALTRAAPKEGSSEGVNPLLRVSKMKTDGFVKLEHGAAIKLIHDVESTFGIWEGLARRAYELASKNPDQPFEVEHLAAVLIEDLVGSDAFRSDVEATIDRELAGDKADAAKRYAQTLAIKEEVAARTFAFLADSKCSDRASLAQVKDTVTRAFITRCGLASPKSEK